MSKTFNVNGICYPNEHYMVNIDSKLAQIGRDNMERQLH